MLVFCAYYVLFRFMGPDRRYVDEQASLIVNPSGINDIHDVQI